MKRKPHTVFIAGLVAMALAGCTSTGAESTAFIDRDRVESGDGPSPSTSSDTAVTASPASSTVRDSASMGNSAAGATDSSISEQSGTSMGTASQSASAASNSTVTSIEVVPRQDGAVTGAGTVAGAAVGGATGTGAAGAPGTGERVYRITLRTDDGRTQVITQEWVPTFSSGDRVRLNSGVIQR
ncbi:MAG: hypothetical protein WKG03_12030 [Telluria sp.]